jgi:NADH:ubiquinone oxidoreductase subunit
LRFYKDQAYFETRQFPQRRVMAKITIFGRLSNIQMLIHTLFWGKRVGADELGNVYYRGRPRPGTARERRWVIYKDKADASRVPPQWHGWLHHQTDVLPADAARFRRSWQKPPLPNLTGTAQAYLPPGDPRKGGRRAAATGDYTAWQPPQ